MMEIASGDKILYVNSKWQLLRKKHLGLFAASDAYSELQ